VIVVSQMLVIVGLSTLLCVLVTWL